ncbi:urea ABC transporter permease subunit UrtB [Pigmentiphaga soli]|uniref:Urea ABC transporter permease subunit UrtB n=1 Tax=Pigmentiphaga soli TaxID=1007095 RepID=A0ABP8HFH1_9BURK
MRWWSRGWWAVLALCWHVGAMALTQQDVQPLAEDDFDAKVAAIQRLAVVGDERAQALLEALADGDALAGDDGRVWIQQGEAVADSVTGAPGPASVVESANPIMLNNRLRGVVAGAQAALGLKAADPAARAAAVDTLLQSNPDAGFKPLVDAARQRETDPAVKDKLETLWAMTALHDPDPAARLEAVKLVAARGRLEMRPLLQPLAGASETDAKVRAAAQAGLDELDRQQQIGELAGTVFAGLSLGSVLLLAALGLAITYGLIGVINMAHGEFLMIGAYATYVVQQQVQQHAPALFAWYPLLSVPAGFFAAACAGFVLERVVLRHLYGRPLETLLTTFGISLLLMQTVRVLFGAQNVQVANPGWMSGGIAIMPNLILPYNRLIILAFSFVVVAIAWTVLNRTRLGLFVRAVTQNRAMAACVGVKTGRVDSYAFAFGAGIAGLGGCALSQIGNVGPDLGQSYIIDSFMAVVLGGVGQLAGTVIGAMGLGMLSKLIEPFWGAVLAKIAVLILIVLFIQKRPQGLFALKGRSAEA